MFRNASGFASYRLTGNPFSHTYIAAAANKMGRATIHEVGTVAPNLPKPYPGVEHARLLKANNVRLSANSVCFAG